MDNALLSKTAAAMVAKGKGILAADESSGTCETRFKSVNVECTEENRRTYRGLLFTTPGVEQYLSGVILFDETLRQKANDGVPFAEYLKKKGVIPGIKVDAGAKNLPLSPGEKVTEGLDNLPKRLEEYFKLGARFAKWRAVITIGKDIPTHTCIYANAHALALEVVRVHDPLLHVLVRGEGARLREQFVDQRGLAVVDVGDDRDVAPGAVHRAAHCT